MAVSQGHCAAAIRAERTFSGSDEKPMRILVILPKDLIEGWKCQTGRHHELFHPRGWDSADQTRKGLRSLRLLGTVVTTGPYSIRPYLIT